MKKGAIALRKFAMLLMIVGLFFVINGGYQIIKTNKAQSENLAAAKSIINNQKSKQSLDSDEKNSAIDIATNFKPSQGETVGILSIPRLDAELPIIEGTHEDELAQGVGHYKGTAYPLQNDQIVLSGHRDTVFRRMGELEIGDILTVEMEYGERSYEIVDTKIVDADDRTIIVPTAPDEVLTVTTCYPFTFIGSAPDRYIITALPIDEIANE